MAGSSRVVLPRIDTNSWLPEDESMEDRLVSMVAEILGLERSSVQLLDSFTDLGGDRKSAAALREACMDIGVAITTKDILECHTLAELQTCIRPCAEQPPCPEPVEPVMIAPIEIHKANRLAVEDHPTWHSRHSSRSSAGSNPTQPTTDSEEALGAHKLVSRIITTKPKAGLLEGKLVAFLTLAYHAPPPAASDTEDNVHLISKSQMFFAGTQIATLRRALRDSRQPDLIPEAWVVLDEMPLAEAGDIDRRCLRTWAQNMNEETFRRITSLDTDETLQQPATHMEKSIQRLVGKILQVPRDQIGVNFSFSRLGGDEASAMELVAMCRHESIHLDAKEVLQDIRLADLAALGYQRGGLAHKWDDDMPDCFDLSPMQQLYVRTNMGGDARLRASGNGSYRFNQSFLLRLKKQFLLEDILAAVEAVVGHHSMLRSRFTLETGNWSQKIFPDVPGSYAFNYHSVFSDHEVETVIERTQASINVESGPVFAVDYFQTEDGQQLIYLAAHHLVVDLPSWRVIIHDFDELLDHGNLSSQRSMPFQRWIELQKSSLKGRGAGGMPSISGGHYSDYGYWGLRDQPNTYGDALEASFSLTPEATSTLENSCNQVLGTESVEIYLAALLLSFAQTFHGRPVPIVWNQEHGRETWSPDIDISETVGWFTSLCPIVQRVGASDDIVGVLRRLKDGRRAIPGRGSHFFASQFYKASGPGTFSSNNPFEIVYSYAGSIQNLERENGVLEQLPIPGRNSASNTADVGSGVGRIAVFEVSTIVDEGAARIKFLYNRRSNLQDRIAAWISNFEHLLLDAVSRLKYHTHELTMADIPHLDVTYDGLARLNKHCQSKLSVASIRDIEAVYPVTATQQGILMKQAQDPDAGFIHTIHEFACRTGASIDTTRLCDAWKLVSTRHAALRTAFAESVTQTGLYDQIVLRRVSPDMLFIDCIPPDDPVDELNSLPNIRTDDSKPPHRLTVCRTPTRTLVKLDINAAICDAASVQILIDDLWQIYVTPGTVPDAVQFPYSDYLEFLKTARQGDSLAFWQKQLQDARPCFFPTLGPLKRDQNRANSHLELEISTENLATFSDEEKVSMEALMRLAWGLVLRSFTGMSDLCFGWQSTGRDDLVTGLPHAVGSFANIIACTMNLSPDDIVTTTLKSVDKQLGSTSVHQYVTMPEVQRALGLKGDALLFNSCLLYTDEPENMDNSIAENQDLELRHLSQRQSSPFDVGVHVRHSQGKLVVDICHSILNEEQACGVANTFGQALQKLTAAPEGLIGSIDLFSDRDYAQLVSWTGETTPGEREGGRSTVHELVDRHAHQTPSAQAVCGWDGELTYHDLLNEATKLAHFLINAGVGPRTLIPVVVDKSRWVPVALLAVLKAGAAFVLIDAEESSSIQPILEKLNAAIAIVATQAVPAVSNLFIKLIVLGDELFSQLQQPMTPLAPVVTPDDPACVLFPSSTSKDLRGIAFSHAAMSTAFLAQGPAARITSESRVMQLSSFGVDIALSEMLTTLVQGGCVCVPSAYERLHNFAGAAERMSVNWTYMTPFLSRQLDPALLPTVKVICFRTRNLDEDTYGQWTGKATVMLAYGTLDVCPLGISFLDVVDSRQLKYVGRPFAGSFWVVNPADNRRLMPVGSIGELVIEGPTLGTGYPSTGQAQTPHSGPSINARKKTKHYKTGHRVRYLEGGIIEFISSTRKEELEIHGKEIDPTDIEMHIRRCLGRGVEVMVELIACRDKTAAPVLAAFLEFTDSPFTGPEDLAQLNDPTKEKANVAKQLVEEGLKNKVEPHLIPSVFIPVKHLPITSSLKVNRRRLQKMIRGLTKENLLSISDLPNPNPVKSTAVKPLPLTQAEEQMRAIWAKILNINEASIDTAMGFIAAGGDDILAAKLVVACKHAGMPIRIADALGNVTLTELCRPWSTTADGSTLPEHYSPASPSRSPQPPRTSNTDNFVEMIIAPKLGVDRMAIKDVVEASTTQTRCIESGMLRGRANVDYFIFNFTGSVDHKKLEEACQTLVTIHPILRTAFVPYNRQVYQAIVRSTDLDFKRYSCSSSRQPALVEKIVKKDQSTPVAFSTPMTKFTLLDGGKNSASSLIMRLCKAQYDDYSVALLVKDLKQLYDGTENPPRRPTFCDFVRATHAAIALGAEEYWKTLLEGSVMTSVVGHNKPHQLSTNIKTLREKVTVKSLSNLGISFETVLKSAWAMVLANLSGSSDIVFGEIIEGRHVRLDGTQSVSSVLGPATNAVPVRIRFPDTSLTPFALLQYVREQQVAGIPFENMGFLNVVEKCTLWAYWTRFSTVVQHRSQDAAVSPQEPKLFRLGSATCKLTVVEPGAKDVYDLLVQSTSRKHGDVELRLTFCGDRVPTTVAEPALRLLCETINMLTSGSIAEPIIPSGYQYRAMEKRIPVPPPFTATDRAPRHPLDDAVSPVTPQQPTTPFTPTNEATRLPEDQIRAIQAAISKAWSSVLKPRTLGVPEEHLHTAAFYDLWGSLIPAAQLAAHLNRELPRLTVPGLDPSSSMVTMEDIIENPTMVSQFQLVARKMSADTTAQTPTTPAAPTAMSSITDPTLPQSPRKNRAATFGSRFRRLTTTITRPGMPARSTSASEVPFSPGIVSPGFLPAGAEHQQQRYDETPPLPALPTTYSYPPGSPEGVRMTPVSRSGSSAAASVTAGSTSSGISTRGSISGSGSGSGTGTGTGSGVGPGIEELAGEIVAGMERSSLVPAPLRRVNPGPAEMTVLTGGLALLRGEEDMVSPLSAGSPGVRFWDVGAALRGAGDSTGGAEAGFARPRQESEDDDIFERMGLVSPIISHGQGQGHGQGHGHGQ